MAIVSNKTPLRHTVPRFIELGSAVDHPIQSATVQFKTVDGGRGVCLEDLRRCRGRITLVELQMPVGDQCEPVCQLPPVLAVRWHSRTDRTNLFDSGAGCPPTGVEQVGSHSTAI